jgi:hypothetical protein
MNEYYIYFYLRPDYTPYYVGKGKNNPMYNKLHTTEAKEKQSQKALNRTKLTCEYCKFDFSPGMYKRWHGEKCKEKL